MFAKNSERRKLRLDSINYFLGLQAVTGCLDASTAVDATAHDASAPHG